MMESKHRDKRKDRNNDGEPEKGGDRNRSYYYDDAHGYEDYVPEADEGPCTDERLEQSSNEGGSSTE